MRELRTVVQQQQCKMADMNSEMAEMKLELNRHQGDINRLKVSSFSLLFNVHHE